MNRKKYEELNSLELDVLKEIGSIGTGNAATALSSVLSKKIAMTLPEVQILGYNEAIRKMGGPETIVAGVLVQMSGEVKGMMLYLQRLDFINLVLESVLSQKIEEYSQLSEMEISALVEIGNIIISSFVSAMTKLIDIKIDLSVPGIAVNMLGGILSVPMVEYGYQTDKIMTIGGKFLYNNHAVSSDLLLLPEVDSLNYILKKLGVSNG